MSVACGEMLPFESLRALFETAIPRRYEHSIPAMIHASIYKGDIK